MAAESHIYQLRYDNETMFAISFANSMQEPDINKISDGVADFEQHSGN